MIATAVQLGAFIVALALALNLYRLIRGPALADRLMAVDTMYVNTVGLLVLYGIGRGTSLYLEAAMLIALIGFVSTAAVAKFLLRGDIIE